MGPAHPAPDGCWGYSLFILIFYLRSFLLNFPIFVYFIYHFTACPCLTCSPCGCAYWTHDVTSDWVSLGSLLALPGLCSMSDRLSLQ